MVIHTHNPSTQEGKAGESENQGHPQIQKEFKMSLSCMSPCLKVKKKKNGGKDVKLIENYRLILIMVLARRRAEYTKVYSTQCEHVSVLLTHEYFITNHACYHDVHYTPCCHKPPQR